MRLLLPTAFLLLLFSCGQQKPKGPTRAERARDYNDRIITIHDSVFAARNNMATEIGSKPIGDARKMLGQFLVTVNRWQDTLRAMPDFEGDSTLRHAAWELLDAYKSESSHLNSMLPILYTEDAIDTLLFPDSIAPPDSLDPNEQLAETYQAIQRKADASFKALDNFYTVQQLFALKFGFRLAVSSPPESK